jgi:hypothetical protein
MVHYEEERKEKPRDRRDEVHCYEVYSYHNNFGWRVTSTLPGGCTKLFGLIDVLLTRDDLVTATTSSSSDMDPLSTVRTEIKSWERSFKAQNGRDPAIKDIKLLPSIGLSSSSTYTDTTSSHFSIQPKSTSSIRSFQNLLLLLQHSLFHLLPLMLPPIHPPLHPENAHHHAYPTFYSQIHVQ